VRIGESFWRSSSRIESLNVSDDEWFGIRDCIESRRLEFINASRRALGRAGPPLQYILGRPTEWKQQPTLGQLWRVARSGFVSSCGREAPAVAMPFSPAGFEEGGRHRHVWRAGRVGRPDGAGAPGRVLSGSGRSLGADGDGGGRDHETEPRRGAGQAA